MCVSLSLLNLWIFLQYLYLCFLPYLLSMYCQKGFIEGTLKKKITKTAFDMFSVHLQCGFFRRKKQEELKKRLIQEGDQQAEQVPNQDKEESGGSSVSNWIELKCPNRPVHSTWWRGLRTKWSSTYIPSGCCLAWENHWGWLIHVLDSLWFSSSLVLASRLLVSLNGMSHALTAQRGAGYSILRVSLELAI